MLHNSRGNRNALRTSSHGVRGVLDIGALHHRTAGQQDGAADVEF